MKVSFKSSTVTTVFEYNLMRDRSFKYLLERAGARWRFAGSLGAGIFLLLFAPPAYFENEFLYGRDRP